MLYQIPLHFSRHLIFIVDYLVNLDTESCREIVHTEIYNSQIDMKLSLLYTD